jgi:hypothetical protein
MKTMMNQKSHGSSAAPPGPQGHQRQRKQSSTSNAPVNQEHFTTCLSQETAAALHLQVSQVSHVSASSQAVKHQLGSEQPMA